MAHIFVDQKFCFEYLAEYYVDGRSISEWNLIARILGKSYVAFPSRDVVKTSCYLVETRGLYYDAKKYRKKKNNNNKPRAYICSKGFFSGLIFGEAWREFCVSKWVG